jgi:Tol biopolymer transport system component
VLTYRSGGIRGTQLVWFDRGGRQLSAIGAAGAYIDPWLSPDEKRVVAARLDAATGTRDIWMFDPARGTESRLTSHPMDDAFPLWSPDGASIVFSSDREGGPNLFQKASSGAGNEEVLLTSPVSKYATGWTRDGRYIVYATWGDKTKWDLWVLPLADRKPIPYLQTEFDSFQAQFSPDGRWIAYASNETNRYEVYVQPFPMTGSKSQISTTGGSQPSWRRDGKELYYLAHDRKLMAVEIKAGATFDAGDPKPLFQTQVSGLEDARNHFAPSADGQRFLVTSIVGESTTAPITVVLNWTADLKR